MTDLATGEATELLQQLIRNRCVNDGTPGSGNEDRQMAVLGSLREGLDLGARQVQVHGRDERVHVESLRLSTELWVRTARDFLA